jgi:hypothetical protein
VGFGGACCFVTTSGRTGSLSGAGGSVKIEGVGMVAARKARFVAQDWSILTTASNHASGSKSSGHPTAIVAIVSPNSPLRPRQNFTMIVFGLVYPDSDTRSQNSSR